MLGLAFTRTTAQFLAHHLDSGARGHLMTARVDTFETSVASHNTGVPIRSFAAAVLSRLFMWWPYRASEMTMSEEWMRESLAMRRHS